MKQATRQQREADRERAVEAARLAERRAREEARITEQRRLFAANLGPARADLQSAMLNRAWELLDAGECEACDALLEFVPEAAATALLDEYFAEGET